MELITQQAMKAGFTGGILVDYPNSTKAKKFVIHITYCFVTVIFLCIGCTCVCSQEVHLRLYLK